MLLFQKLHHDQQWQGGHPAWSGAGHCPLRQQAAHMSPSTETGTTNEPTCAGWVSIE